MLATWNSRTPWEKDPLKPPQKTPEGLPHLLAGNKQECDDPQTKRPMTSTHPMREFDNKLEVADQELALRREAASLNKSLQATRDGGFSSGWLAKHAAGWVAQMDRSLRESWARF